MEEVLNWAQTLLGWVLTVATAITVYVITRGFAEAAIETRRVIGQVQYALRFYADLYMNPGTSGRAEIPERQERMKAASQELRRLASELPARAYGVPAYTLLRCLFLLPRIADVEAASAKLMGLSNSVFHGEHRENEETRKGIQKDLGLRVW